MSVLLYIGMMLYGIFLPENILPKPTAIFVTVKVLFGAGFA